MSNSLRTQLLWLVVLMIVCVPGVILGNEFKDSLGHYVPETMPMPSTYNKKPSGYSAFFELLQKAGVQTKRWQSPYRELLKKNISGTLVVIEPFETPLPAELELIDQWLNKGNDLVYIDTFTFGTGHTVLHHFQLEHKLVRLREKTLPVNVKFAERAYAPAVQVSCDSLLDGGTAVVGSQRNAAFTKASTDSGRCLVGTMPSVCANSRITDVAYRSNFQFLVNWLAASKQPVLFDEKSHGYSNASNAMIVLLRGPVGYLILQILFILAVACLSLNQRFERPLKVNKGRKISNLEFIDGLASTYERVRARDAVWSMFFNPFKARLCKALAVAPHESNVVIATKWAEVGDVSVASCEAFLQASDQALADRYISRQELVRLMETCDELANKTAVLPAVKSVMGA